MSQAYDRELCESARKVASEKNVLLHEGVYVGLSGPSFETPAHLRFLRTAGAELGRHVDRPGGYCGAPATVGHACWVSPGSVTKPTWTGILSPHTKKCLRLAA